MDTGASSVMNACRARLRLTPLALRVAKKGSYRCGMFGWRCVSSCRASLSCRVFAWCIAWHRYVVSSNPFLSFFCPA